MIEQINLQNVPQHVAIIMDGNGRWAKQQGLDRLFGHSQGVESVRDTLKTARELGIKYLTLYAFSTENWNRPKSEIDGLMDLLIEAVTHELMELNNNGVRLLTIGDLNALPENCQKSLSDAIEKTSNNKDITLVLALNYSSQSEITTAIKNIIADNNSGKITIDEINPELIDTYLYTKDIPDPELLIRTSGERRVSNFLLWQIAYAEFHFTPVFWPDFRRQHLIDAIIDYQKRERRFGKTSDQINKA